MRISFEKTIKCFIKRKLGISYLTHKRSLPGDVLSGRGLCPDTRSKHSWFVMHLSV